MTRKLTPPSFTTQIGKILRRLDALERQQKPTETTAELSAATLPLAYFITSELRHASDFAAFNGLKAVATCRGDDDWAECHLGPVLLDVNYRFLVRSGINATTVELPAAATLRRDIIVSNIDCSEVLRAFSVEDIDWWSRPDAAATYGDNDLPASGDWTVETIGSDLTFDESVSPETGHVLSDGGGVYWASLYLTLDFT